LSFIPTLEKKKRETQYPEIARNNCSDGTFSFIADWSLRYNQAFHSFISISYYTLLPKKMTAFKDI